MLLRSRAAAVARSLYPCTFRPAISTSAAMPLRAKLPGEQRSRSTKAIDDEVLFHTNYGVRAIELNRPQVLNALSGTMAAKILERLREYEKSQLANIIVIKGAGEKGFCAGGDVKKLAQQNFPDGVKPSPSGIRASAEYFNTEYTLDHLVATYSKPYVAFMDGITMGGGAGLSIHAPFRIATERTAFAMPETKIGFFTDVGASFFLPRLDGQLGTYLALTGEMLKGVDNLYAGIATHYLHSSSLPDLEQRLAELQFPDSATLEQKYEIVDSTIEEFSTGLPPDRFSLAGEKRQLIDDCFSPITLAGILNKLDIHKTTNTFIDKTYQTILTRCPLSVLVTLALLRVGGKRGITSAFQHEAIVAARFMHSREFYIGVENLLILKKPDMPAWPGLSLTELANESEKAEALLNEYILPKEGEDERLELDRGTDYTRYPHWWVGLPSEEEIKKKVEAPYMAGGSGLLAGREEVVQYFVDTRRGKEGVREKVEECLDRKTRKGEKTGKLEWVYDVNRFA